jgi:hypothetical protein
LPFKFNLQRYTVGGDFLAVGFAAIQLEPSFKKLRELGIYAHVFCNVGTCVPMHAPGGSGATLGAGAGAGAGAGSSVGLFTLNPVDP